MKPSDFVFTLSDDEVGEPAEESESEVEETQKGRTKKEKKKESEIASGFSFEEDDDGQFEAPWSMTEGLVDIAKKPEGGGTTVDEKIKSKRMKRELTGRTITQESEEEEGTPSVDENVDGDGEGDDGDSTASESDDDGDGDEKDTNTEPNGASDFFNAPKAAEGTDFASLKLSKPVLKAVEAMGYRNPTPVQQKSIPVAMAGQDVCACAQTGSGKTAAFVLPALERLLYRNRSLAAIRILILVPTRELAVQGHSMTQRLSRYTDVRTALVVGGLSLKVQEASLRARPDIVVATPGRMIDHIRNSHSVTLDDVEMLILDEADRMLDEGFADELDEIIRACPQNRQTLLFSATLTSEVKSLMKLALRDPVYIRVDPPKDVASTITQEFVRIRKGHESDVEAILLSLCKRTFKNKTIIFATTKQQAHRLKIIFGLAGLDAQELHGNLTQAMRLEALDLFRDQKCDYLICTDLAARGLDILGVDTVLNVEMPKTLKMYIHRVGRCGRAGARGRSVTCVSEDKRPLMKKIAKKSRGKALARAIDPKVIEFWNGKVREMESDVKAILKEEKEERQIRLAEMEMNKAQNMIDYEGEIFARPKRTWFQNEKAKLEAKKRSFSEVMGPEDQAEGNDNDNDNDDGKGKKRRKKDKNDGKPERDDSSGLSRAKKRKKAMIKQIEQDTGKSMKQIVSSQQAVHRIAKKARREGKSVESALGIKKKKKKKGSSSGGGGGGGGGGGTDRLPGTGGGTDSAKRGKPRTGSFKSKKRFKRR